MRRILAKATLFAMGLAALAPAAMGQGDMAPTEIGALRPGQEVMLRAVVLRITDEDEFILSDASGQVPVYVGPNRVPAAQGEMITVIGRVDDDGPRAVYATRIINADGAEFALHHHY